MAFSNGQILLAESFGLDRLRAAIQRLASLNGDEMIRGLYAEAHDFVGGRAQADDVTIVVVKRRDEHSADS